MHSKPAARVDTPHATRYVAMQYLLLGHKLMIFRKNCVSLALQGGGSHGAFTWGVLDRLLQEQELRLDAISGTSAGAMNAAVLAHGLATGNTSFR